MLKLLNSPFIATLNLCGYSKIKIISNFQKVALKLGIMDNGMSVSYHFI